MANLWDNPPYVCAHFIGGSLVFQNWARAIGALQWHFALILGCLDPKYIMQLLRMHTSQRDWPRPVSPIYLFKHHVDDILGRETMHCKGNSSRCPNVVNQVICGIFLPYELEEIEGTCPAPSAPCPSPCHAPSAPYRALWEEIKAH